MKVVSIASEVASIHKTGGLGDVVRDLALELRKNDVEIDVLIPMYSHLVNEENMRNKIWDGTINFGGDLRQVSLYMVRIPNTDINCYMIYEPKIISNNSCNDVARYGLLSKVVVKLLIDKIITCDLLHLHDWHLGLLPLIAKHEGLLIPTLLTIHNVLFQGDTEPTILDDLGIKWDYLPELLWDVQDGDLNFLMQGIIHSDYVTTVSPTYKNEILSEPSAGGMSSALINKNDKFSGILNGIDINVWNPENDFFLDSKFNISNYREGKGSARNQLSNSLKKKIEEDDILLSYIGRADSRQKGIGLILDAVNNMGLLNSNLRLVMLTEGDDQLENQIIQTANRFDRMDAFIKFDDQLAHVLYAASDMSLIPSWYEPCGLVQMMAMRYGSVPIARATGGLIDTIDDKVNGYLFEQFEARSLLESIKIAEEKFRLANEWDEIVKNCMVHNWSWENSAREYKALYTRMIEKNSC